MAAEVPGSGPPSFGEEPPSYREHLDDPNELLQPITLVLHGRFVYAHPNEASPLYELSRVIHTQGLATTSIEFQRLDYRVKTTGDGIPNVAPRPKHLYNLSHVPVLFEEKFDLSMQALSRKTLGNVVLKKSPFPHTGHRASKAFLDEGITTANKYAHYFTVKRRRRRYEWSDAQGKAVATQEETASSDGGPAEYKLVVKVSLTRPMMDGLVALWCLWLWHRHAIHTREKKGGWKEFKRIMQQPHPEIPK